MKFGILINEGPFTHQASDSAYRFAEAVLADCRGSSRAGVATAEAADPGVSIDLILRAIFVTGARPANILSRKVVRHEGVTIAESA